MRIEKQKNSGFSLIELIIAIAVLAFLMLAVSSFMGSSVKQTKKEQTEVKIQTQAQETYSLITDSIMQAQEILIVGYTADNPDLIDFSKDGNDSSANLTKKYFVKDEETATALKAKENGIPAATPDTDIVYFSKVKADEPIYITYMRIESAVPLDIEAAGGNPNIIGSQYIKNNFTNEDVIVESVEQNSRLVYSVNDTMVSEFYFEGNNLYYGRRYAFMNSLDDVVDMTSTESKDAHLFSKYFSYNNVKIGATDGTVTGCVASIDAADSTIGIDLYYKQMSMGYTTYGRVNPRNSYVLVPKN